MHQNNKVKHVMLSNDFNAEECDATEVEHWYKVWLKE